MIDEGREYRNAIRGKGLTLEQAATKIGVTRATLYNHLRMQKLEDRFRQLIKTKLGIDLSNRGKAYPTYDETHMLAEEAVRYEAKPVEESGFMEVPVLSVFAQAGYLKGQSDEAAEKKLDKMLIPREYDKGHYLVVEVQGDSMNDNTSRALQEGDKLLIKELPREFWKSKLHIHNHIWVIVHKDGIAFKQIVKHDLDKSIITCHSWNTFYNDYDIKLKDVIRLFYVKKLVERIIKP